MYCQNTSVRSLKYNLPPAPLYGYIYLLMLEPDDEGMNFREILLSDILPPLCFLQPLIVDWVISFNTSMSFEPNIWGY